MGVKVAVTVNIKGSPAAVFAQLTDVAHQTEWVSVVKGVRDISDTPVRLGSTYTSVAQFMGRKMENKVKITAYEPGKRYAEDMSGKPGGLMAFELTPDGDGTRVNVTADISMGGLLGLLSPLVKMQVRKQSAGDMGRLKARVEGKK
jgi:carbon monoxide dehydrogenase subunit G